jgi:hypothetical protein
MPADTLHATYYADVDASGAQYRPLLDMALEVGVGSAKAGIGFAKEADGRERVLHGDSVAIAESVCLLKGDPAGRDGAPEHVGAESCPLLVSEKRHDQGSKRRASSVIQGSNDFEAAEHPQTAVEPSGRGDRIDVRADHHGTKPIILAGAPCEHIANPVDPNLETCPTQLLHHVDTPGAIRGREREPAHAAQAGAGVVKGTNRAKRIERSVKPITIN